MANVEIIELTALTNPASSDVLPIVDVGADETKKVTIADLLENAGSGNASAAAFAFDGDADTGMYRTGANALGFTTGGTGRLFIDSSGNVGIGDASPAVACDVVGQVRASTGILFGSDTAAANALDDYEEGTWTVEFYDAVSGGNQSATTATGSYTKVGRFVHLQFDVNNINTSGLTAVNQLFFSLPFVGLSSPFQEYKGACAIAGSSLASTPISTHLVSNSARAYFLVNNAASGIFSNFQISSITSGANGFRASLSYMA